MTSVRSKTLCAALVAVAALGLSAVSVSPASAASIGLAAATVPATGASLTLNNTGPVYEGTQVSFSYAAPAADVRGTNWVGFYPVGVKPGTQASIIWQYTGGASGTVSFDTSGLGPGSYDVYYLYNDGYDVLSGPLTLRVQTAVPAPLPPAPDAGTGPNLLVNGDAETGEGSQIGIDTNTVPGWTQTGLMNATAYGAIGGEGVGGFPTASTLGPDDRGSNFFSGGGGGVSTGTQTSDVRSAADSIDGGNVSFNLTGWLGGSGAKADNATVTSTFLAKDGTTALGSATLAPVTPEMRGFGTELRPEQATGSLPVGTRWIRTVMTFTGPQPHDRTGHAQGYVDDLSLRISAPVDAPKPIAPAKADVPRYDHVFVVMMENQDYAGIIGNKAAPYINSLLPKGANLAGAMGEVHPSDPNYVALAGGSLFTVNSNSPFSSTVNAPHIGDLVTQSGGTWRGYMQNANGACDTTGHGAYTIDDLPFYFFKDVKSDPANCQEHLLPLTQMTADLQSTTTTPTFSWLSADDCYDMEGCGVAAGDGWLKSTLEPIFQSPAWTTQRSLLILTWDEDAADGQKNLQNVPTIVLGSQDVQAGAVSTARYTHYSMLRTIEEALHLPNLTKNDMYAPAINDIWTTRGSSHGQPAN
jgi:hypothetical protein